MSSRYVPRCRNKPVRLALKRHGWRTSGRRKCPSVKCIWKAGGRGGSFTFAHTTCFMLLSLQLPSPVVEGQVCLGAMKVPMMLVRPRRRALSVEGVTLQNGANLAQYRPPSQSPACSGVSGGEYHPFSIARQPSSLSRPFLNIPPPHSSIINNLHQ